VLCVYALAELAFSFPYPSPLIKPLLPPKLRWPADQVTGWVRDQVFDRDFARYFARDPEREIPAAATLVSPADGIIQDIAMIGDTTYFVVGLSFWDVHVVRTPVAGTVKSIELEGTYAEKQAPLPAWQGGPGAGHRHPGDRAGRREGAADHELLGQPPEDMGLAGQATCKGRPDRPHPSGQHGDLRIPRQGRLRRNPGPACRRRRQFNFQPLRIRC
jgi:hypothetical protein